jgi:hypothetical protein
MPQFILAAMLLAGSPAEDQNLAFSAYLCALGNARDLELKELKEDQRYSKMTGVVDLAKRNRIKLWLQKLDAELSKQRNGYSLNVKDKPMKCTVPKVKALSKCFAVWWDDQDEDMTTELATAPECQTQETQDLFGLVIGPG